jgi:GWxTD domain-containing protein
VRALLLFVISASITQAAEPGWLDRVEPIISAAEKKTYLSLTPEARRKFEENFWSDKAITADDYFQRLAYVDSRFGSNRPGSGANTDQGRVYLSLGAPARITRIASSRVFVPLEIWYYESVRGVLNTELRLIFYQKGNMGFPKLYSPEVDTIRALLVPQASTRTMFGPNDGITETDIRKTLKVGPAEDEVISASVAVAAGIKYSGNGEILGRIASPQEMLARAPRAEIRSRLIVGRPKLDVVQTASVYGGSQVDFALEAKARREVDIQVIEGAATVYHNQVHLGFSKAEAIVYAHRLDLLRGSYRLVVTVDGAAYPYAIEVPERTVIGGILRADSQDAAAGRHTPFEFDGRQLELNPEGRYAVVAVARPGNVTWMIRQGTRVLWKSSGEAKQIAMVELPSKGIAPGVYRLEASGAEDGRSTELIVKLESFHPAQGTLISFNANLAPASRFAFVGHQWLLRGKPEEARQSLAASIRQGATDEAQVELARADALAGNLDAARDRVRSVLATRPNHFEALSVFAYIETKLQDYPVAAELYRRALSVQDSPALRAALAQLPAR